MTLTDSLPGDEQVLIRRLAEKLIGDRWPKQRIAAAKQLGDLGQGATAALGSMADAANNDPDPKVRRAAEDALERILVSKPAVLDALAHEKRFVRIAGIKAVGKPRFKESISSGDAS